MSMYYALTTEDAQMLGWSILASARTRREAEAHGNEQIVGMDMSADTRRKNLRVVSRTVAVRKFGLRHPLVCGCCEMPDIDADNG
jgi:hypothetical protein